MRVKFKLGEADGAKYPEGKEWFIYDSKVLADMSGRELMRIEDRLDGHSIWEIERDFVEHRILGMVGVMYLGRHLAGVLERWENFDPQVWQAEFESAPSEAPDPTSGSEPDESPTP